MVSLKLKMQLRDFYYLDSIMVENLLGYLDGFIQEEHHEINRSENTKNGEAKVPYVGNFSKSGASGEETTRSGRLSPELKFKKVFDYLESEGLDKYDAFDEELWNMLINEEEILEVRGSLHFTKVYDLERTTNQLGGFLRGLGVTEESEVDIVTTQASKMRELQERNGIPIRLNTTDGVYTFIAYLNEKFLQKEQSEVIGNDYKMLCRVERVIPKNARYNLFNVKELEQTLLNREQRRRNQKLPEVFLEKVIGPAAVVLPIAIYR